MGLGLSHVTENDQDLFMEGIFDGVTYVIALKEDVNNIPIEREAQM